MQRVGVRAVYPKAYREEGEVGRRTIGGTIYEIGAVPLDLME